MASRRKGGAPASRASKGAGKPTSGKPTSGNEDTSQTQLPQLPLQRQQAILDQFRNAFPVDSAESLRIVIQKVKGHLYDRDFLTAFSQLSYLQAYALRWSASRALTYAHIFHELDLLREWKKAAPASNAAEATGEADVHATRAYRVLCIGGGAGAELVGLASIPHGQNIPARIEATAIDIADWSAVLQTLERTMLAAPSLSKYASEAVRAANQKSFVQPDQLKIEFLQQDVLQCEDSVLRHVLKMTSLCTIMFTLNELFTSSIAKTTALLLKLTDMMESGSDLLVADSPGSYSEIKLGKGQQTKQYPMKWLMDHALLDTAGPGKWEKVMSDDSRWFRIPSHLNYLIELENMRYQIHLYRRL